MEEKKPRPAIGFLGLLLSVCGCSTIFMCASIPNGAESAGFNTATVTVAGVVALIGVIILIYALATGNIKFFG